MHGVGFFGIVADVLLHFVQHHQGQGKVVALRQGLGDGIDHLLVADVCHLRELGFEQLAGFGLAIGKTRAHGQQSLGQMVGDVHVG